MTDALTHRRRASSRECVPDRRWTCDACWTSRITIRYNHARADRVSPCTRLYRRIRYPVIYRIYSETGSFAPRTIDAPRNLSAQIGTTKDYHGPRGACRGRAVRCRAVPEYAAARSDSEDRGVRPPVRSCTAGLVLDRPNAEQAPICRFLTRRRETRAEPLGPASLDLPGDAWRYDPPAVYFGLMRSSHTR